MFETIVTVALVLAIVIVALLLYAATRPNMFAISRTLAIRAPADRIFPLISSPRAMNTWNPFVEPDPAIKLTYSGPESGRGAANEWAGNRQVGEGRFEVVDAASPTKVVGRLTMVKPMKADNKVEFTLQPAGDATNVSWTMSGRQPLMAKVMTIFIDCDKMVGSQFEKGLGKLKTIAERPA